MVRHNFPHLASLDDVTTFVMEKEPHGSVTNKLWAMGFDIEEIERCQVAMATSFFPFLQPLTALKVRYMYHRVLHELYKSFDLWISLKKCGDMALFAYIDDHQYFELLKDPPMILDNTSNQYVKC